MSCREKEEKCGMERKRSWPGDCEAGGKDGMRGEVRGPHTMLC